MKWLSNTFTSASGSIGGTTFSRNRGGNYTRARTVPTNPNTVNQQVVREILGGLSNDWNNTLTQLQRDNWNLYANNVPIIDTLGQTIKLSGFNHFCRSNSPRMQAGLAKVLNAPTEFNLGATPTVTVFNVYYNAGWQVTANVPAPTLVTDRLLVYIGRPVSPGRLFFRGPYQYTAALAATVGGLFEEDDGTYTWTVSEGQRVAFRCRVTLTDGRLSSEAQGSTIATSGA